MRLSDRATQSTLSLASLLRCCAAAHDIDTERVLAIVRWMAVSRYAIKAFETRDVSRALSRAIAHAHALSELEHIEAAVGAIALRDIFVDTRRVGAAHEAHRVFDAIASSARNSVSLNAAMTALTHNGCDQDALALYDAHTALRNERSHALAITACANRRDLERGTHILAELPGDIENAFIRNALISLRAECGDCDGALAVFDAMGAQRDAVSLNTMLKALIAAQRASEAMSLFEAHRRALADALSNVFALRACAALRDAQRGEALVARCDRNCVRTAAAVVGFFGAVRRCDAAQLAFDAISRHLRDAALLNAMMAVLIAHEGRPRALALYREHAALGTADDASHALAVQSGADAFALSVAPRHFSFSRKLSLIAQFGAAKDMRSVRAVFEAMEARERQQTAAVNAMKTALHRNALHCEALALYDASEAQWDAVSHVLALKACVATGAFEKGAAILSKVSACDDKVQGASAAAIEFHAHFGDMDAARRVFEAMGDAERDGVCVNAMMKALLAHAQSDEALAVYDRFDALRDDVSPLLAVRCCLRLKDAERGQAIFARVARPTLRLKNAMIDLLGKLGHVRRARALFDDIGDADRNIVSVNALMDALCLAQRHSECVALFERSRLGESRVSPDAVTLAIVLRCCVDERFSEFGRRLHDELRSDASDASMMRDGSVQCALINLYGRRGDIAQCEAVFGECAAPSLPVWHAMLNALGRHGEGQRAQALFARSQRSAVPLHLDRFVAMALFLAFGRSGMASEAQRVWTHEIEARGRVDLQRDAHVVASLVDCLARAGWLQWARRRVSDFERATEASNEAMWTALLSGCRTHGDERMTRRVFEEMAQRFDLTDTNSSVAGLLRGL